MADKPKAKRKASTTAATRASAQREALDATTAQTEERVSTVLGLLMTGYSRRHILQYAAEKTNWAVATRMIDKYIAAANAEIKAIGRADRETEMVKTHQRLHELYMRCLRIQDYKTCLAVQKEIALLYGLHEPVRVEVEMVHQLGDTIAGLLRAVVTDLKLTAEQRAAYPAIARRHLELLAPSSER